MVKENVTTQDLLKGLSDFLHLKDERADSNHKKVLEENGLDNYSLTELHVIHCIGEESMRNLTTISEYMSMTRGAVSKICSRLQKKGAIEKIKLADNQKEIFFILTAEGEHLFHAHEVLHQQSQAKWSALFEQYDQQEKQTIKRFFSDVVGRFR
ncbi:MULTISPECIES: MarR family winged helix-turn-helix transcriptional regulator [Proteus]|uniref:MarR family winged helix-turn-helix transcriptional regulator n=1 Tax=Proteus TaxID=583 RepID=UPI000BFC7D37|nr:MULTISPECIES: MarR family transcriptional regulator [Proteus]ATM98521.1 MarR family transcriptional regulator [Proteus vulgaris]MBG2837598.1 MarR family transcriptional regulator [Proteus terrae subsp. cibarius]MBG2869042.1 MarR family transcriptional regulator [Proteus terrae subsp. cibarius]MBJ2110789.1 MarR family transcriptional regulator [Proteus terrae]MBJ2134471.1 MarR family transcriptional regulator [Proteus terrae]